MRLIEIDPENKTELILSGKNVELMIGRLAFNMRVLHLEIKNQRIDKTQWKIYLDEFIQKSNRALEILNQLPVQNDNFVTNLRSKIENDLKEIQELTI